MNLYNDNNQLTWKNHLDQYNQMIKLMSINKENLTQLDEWLWNNLKKNVYTRFNAACGKLFITKNELINIMKWKLTRGKFRPLLKLVESNTEDSVKLCTNKALNILHKDHNKWKQALTELKSLKGIGVATASIILAVFVPEVCPFMSDEAYKSVCSDKMSYTNKEYYYLQQKLVDKANALNSANNVNKIWDTEMIGKALWVASVINT